MKVAVVAETMEEARRVAAAHPDMVPLTFDSVLAAMAFDRVLVVGTPPRGWMEGRKPPGGADQVRRLGKAIRRALKAANERASWDRSVRRRGVVMSTDAHGQMSHPVRPPRRRRRGRR